MTRLSAVQAVSRRKRKATERKRLTQLPRLSSILLPSARDEGEERQQNGADEDDVEGKQRRVTPARHADHEQERRRAADRPSCASSLARRTAIEQRNEHQEQTGRAEKENGNR